MIAYPGYHSLGEWEHCRMILENQIDFSNRPDSEVNYFRLKN
jgi:hypothetical protein